MKTNLKCENCEGDLLPTYYREKQIWKKLEKMFYCPKCDKLKFIKQEEVKKWKI